MKLAAAALALLSALAPVAAQTTTSCNPLNSTCSADAALGTTFNQTYNQGSSLDSRLWNSTAMPVSFGDNGAEFQIVKSGDSVTLQTNFYIFFGRVEVWMQAAAGQGIISALTLLSDDLDEIDWEIMGSNTTMIENNYYGKGNQSERNALYAPCNDAPGGFHNYTVHWTQSAIQWWIDNKMVRQLVPDQAPGGYPQTPSFFRMGVWAGGDPSEPPGTIAWAGGETDYSKGPFTMVVRNITIDDYTTNATSYSYGDRSGSWESIKVQKYAPFFPLVHEFRALTPFFRSVAQSAAAQVVNAPPPETMAQKWAGLSTGVKIAIIAVPSGIALLLAIFGGFCCIKQRALGRRERAIEDAQWEKSTAELMAYRRQMASGRYAQGSKEGYFSPKPLNTPQGYSPAMASTPRPF